MTEIPDSKKCSRKKCDHNIKHNVAACHFITDMRRRRYVIFLVHFTSTSLISSFYSPMLSYALNQLPVSAEYLYEKLMHKPITINDFSAVVTGLLLALNLPPTLPWWMGVLGAVFAIIVVKQLFGGLGQNFMNPALGARCFLLICFAGKMTYFVYDGVTGPTPLAELKAGETVNTLSMLLGNIRGTIGETSVVAIMIGAMFLILMGVIDLRIPGTYIVTFVIFITLFGGHGFDPQYITAHLCGGGLMLGAWFMATDYVTSPITSKGKILFGICLGCLTGLFRLFGGSAEGVSYAIIISNLLVPLIEKVTLPKPFGKGGEK